MSVNMYEIRLRIIDPLDGGKIIYETGTRLSLDASLEDFRERVDMLLPWIMTEAKDGDM